MGEFALGQSVPRFEDPRLVRGGGRYVSDLKLPGMVHGVVLRSPHAHAKIKSIDTTQAKQAPGVLAVLTGADWEASGYGDLPVPKGPKRRDGSPLYRPRFPALVKDRVRWVGDYVAFVIAETVAQATDAAELIEVDYEILPAITKTGDAAKDGAALVYEDCPNNVCFVHFEGDKAAADAALAKADHVIKQHFVINRVTAAAMEPRGCVGVYDKTEGRYTIHTTLQRTHNFRTEIAESVLKLPESKVRVIAGDIGGSFGMKSAVYNECALVVWGAKVVGRPVKWVSTRSEAFVSDAHGRDNDTVAELALDKNGKFVGLRVKTSVNLGAYLQSSGNAFVSNLGSLVGVYTIPAAHVDVTAVFTNTNPTRPYRGNGRPEAAYVIERLVDLAADELGIEPTELRRRNMIPESAMPYKSALTFKYDSGEFEKNMDKALKMADVAGFAKRRTESKKKGKLRGLGISYSIEKAAAPGYEGAEIRFDRSGAATLYSGSVTHGQGHETVFKQLVCDKLGLDPKDVQYVQGDTDQVFFGEGTGGSRTASICGSAFLMATDRITEKAKGIAAKMLKVDPKDLKFDEGLFSSSATNETMTVKDIAKASINAKNLPDGFEPGLIATAIYQCPAANFPNGTHICEVEIDPETGTTQMQRYNVVDDVGTVLNPLLLHGQVIGGVAQGVGQILMEDICFDTDSGQNLSGSFMDYAMPRADDLSSVHVDSAPVPTKNNLLGSKGAGEAGCVGAMPAVANAIVDALSEFGIRHIEMPATPERVWRALQQAKGHAAAAE